MLSNPFFIINIEDHDVCGRYADEFEMASDVFKVVRMYASRVNHMVWLADDLPLTILKLLESCRERCYGFYGRLAKPDEEPAVASHRDCRNVTMRL
jgi:hypothetical protein